VVNVFAAYPFLLAAALFPSAIWLGFGATFFWFGQFLVHGVMTNKKLKTIYNPGALTMAVGVGFLVYFVVYVISNDLASAWDWVAGVALIKMIIAGKSPVPPPFAIGHECVAEVVAVAHDVTHAVPGDLVVVPWHIACGRCERCQAGLFAHCMTVPYMSTSQVVAATGRTIASVGSCSTGSGASRHATFRSPMAHACPGPRSSAFHTMIHIMPWERTDTKDRMVSSAALLLRERGVAGTSFAKVLEHSGTPRGSLGHHFPGGKREMVADAVRWAGGVASTAMRHAVERGDSPAELFAMVCGFYRRALVDTDCAAGCAVGNVAQEAHDDERLRAAANEIFDDWRSILGASLTAAGHTASDATDLAELCIAGLEGALLLARVQRSPDPIDRVQRQLQSLLTTPPTTKETA
jgi:TetR/AcrR family transcriptional regulator, lmrAB and yxaGH operons repressor